MSACDFPRYTGPHEKNLLANVPYSFRASTLLCPFSSLPLFFFSKKSLATFYATIPANPFPSQLRSIHSLIIFHTSSPFASKTISATRSHSPHSHSINQNARLAHLHHNRRPQRRHRRHRLHPPSTLLCPPPRPSHHHPYRIITTDHRLRLFYPPRSNNHPQRLRRHKNSPDDANTPSNYRPCIYPHCVSSWRNNGSDDGVGFGGCQGRSRRRKGASVSGGWVLG